MVPLHFSIWIRAISSSRCSSSPSWSSREPGPFCNLQCSASVRSHGLPRYHDRWGTTSLRSPSFLCSVIRNRAGSNDAGCADSARQLLLPRGFSPAHVRHARCPVRKHHPVAFMGIFLFFLGSANDSAGYQDRFTLGEGFLLAFFLASLVVLAGHRSGG